MKRVFLLGSGGIDVYRPLRDKISSGMEVYMIDVCFPTIKTMMFGRREDENTKIIPIDEYCKGENAIKSGRRGYGLGCSRHMDEAKLLIDCSPETMKKIKNLLLDSDQNIVVFGAGGGFGGACALRILDDIISEDACANTTFLYFYPFRNDSQRPIDNANFVQSRFDEVKDRVAFEVFALSDYVKPYLKLPDILKASDLDVVARICEIFELE